MLERACSNAGIPHKINQHLLRKLWISTATNLNLNQVIIKILSFKSVSEDVLTYFLDRTDLRDAWQKVVDMLPLEPRTNGRVDNIQEALDLVMKTLRKMIERELKIKPKPKKGYLTDKEILKIFLEREENV